MNYVGVGVETKIFLYQIPGKSQDNNQIPNDKITDLVEEKDDNCTAAIAPRACPAHFKTFTRGLHSLISDL